MIESNDLKIILLWPLCTFGQDPPLVGGRAFRGFVWRVILL